MNFAVSPEPDGPWAPIMTAMSLLKTYTEMFTKMKDIMCRAKIIPAQLDKLACVTEVLGAHVHKSILYGVGPCLDPGGTGSKRAPIGCSVHSEKQSKE